MQSKSNWKFTAKVVATALNSALRHDTSNAADARRYLVLKLAGQAWENERLGDDTIKLTGKKISKGHNRITGYVSDFFTGQNIGNASLYLSGSSQSALSAFSGYFALQIPDACKQINVSKAGYRDTVYELTQWNGSDQIEIFLTKQYLATSQLSTTAAASPIQPVIGDIKSTLADFAGYIHRQNIQQPIRRNFQIGLLPFLGNQLLMSACYYNRFSFNLIGGYTRGLKGVAVAPGFNMVQKKASGVLLAGLFNSVADTMCGLQASMLFNYTGGYMKGVQITTYSNFNNGHASGAMFAWCSNYSRNQAGLAVTLGINASKSLTGLQLAGLGNFNAFSKGVSVAGFINVSDSAHNSAQLSAVLNMVANGSSLAQCSGLLNYTKVLSSLQLGAINVCDSSDNACQIAGVVNISTNGKAGIQISPFVNYAKTIDGVQIGLFNFSDTAKGLPIGLFSHVRTGIHQLEYSSDEWFPFNFSYRTGIRKLHNFYSVGFRRNNAAWLWHITYGMGSLLPFSEKWSVDLNLGISHISQGNWYNTLSEQIKLFTGVEFKIIKKIAISAGPTFNGYFTNNFISSYGSTYRNISPARLWANDDSVIRIAGSFWIGGKIALRFF